MSDTRDWWPEDFGVDLPAFRVQRQVYGLVAGGDYVRGSSVSTLPHTALRYPSTVPEDFAAVGKALLYVRPFDYNTVQILWSWPSHVADTWIETALVRSCFGHPSTPRDGETVFRALRTDFDHEVDGEEITAPPPIVYDQPLLPGRNYYYTLFFRMNPIDWVPMMSDSTMLPRDYQHREHMWNCIPPYYQFVDDSYRPANGFLRQFLTVFGFEMDFTREWVEGLLNLYNIDFTPMALLKGVGANFGMPYQQGIGDIRYRAWIANTPTMSHIRGTARGLEMSVEAVSKYECEVTGSETLMLYPDDSDFFRSTGNWGGVHPLVLPKLTAQESILTSLAWNDIYVGRVNKPPAPLAGRGVMRIYTSKADATQKIIVPVGDSRIRADDPALLNPSADTVPPVDVPTYRDSTPVTGGISINPGWPYGFAIWAQAPEANVTVQPIIIWVGASGAADDVIDVSLGIPLGTGGTTWKQYKAQGQAPDTSRYAVPALFLFDRLTGSLTNRSPALDVCAAMFYRLGDDDSAVAILPPDRYMTLGDPAEKLGLPKSGFEGFIMGSPQQRT